MIGLIQIVNKNYYISRFKDSFFYFGSSIIALPVSVITSPLFAKNLSAYDFSAIGYFGAIMSFFLPITNLSFYDFYMLDYYKRDNAEKKKF